MPVGTDMINMVRTEMQNAQQVQMQLMTLQIQHDTTMAAIHAVQKASEKIRG